MQGGLGGIRILLSTNFGGGYSRPGRESPFGRPGVRRPKNYSPGGRPEIGEGGRMLRGSLGSENYGGRLFSKRSSR